MMRCVVNSVMIGMILAVGSGCTIKKNSPASTADVAAPVEQKAKAPDPKVDGDVKLPSPNVPVTPPQSGEPNVPEPKGPEAPLGQVSGAEACANANLKNFFFSVQGDEESRSPDFCEFAKGKLPALAEKMIRKFGELHAKTARFLGISRKELYGDGVQLELQSMLFGAMDSFYSLGEDKIYLGVSADWEGGPFNESVYVHELGHALANGKSERIPSVLHELSMTPLIVESFADFMAIGVTGTVISATEDFEGCMQRARVVGKYNTYDFPGDFFKKNYTMRKIVSCCGFLKERGKITSKLQPMCDDAVAKASNLPQLDRHTHFDAQDYLHNRDAYDVHQIGIPLNGFLQAVAKDLGLDAKALLFDALSKVSSDNKLRKPYSCVLPMMIFAGEFKVEAHSMESVLNAIREGVPQGKLPDYDALWKKHSMDKAIAIARADAENIAAQARSKPEVEATLTRFEKDLDPQLLQNQCYKAGGELLDGKRAECLPKCSGVL